MKALAIFALASALAVPAAMAQNNSSNGQLQSNVQHALRNSHFRNVQVSVQNNVVTLTGTVPLFQDKISAEQKARHVHGVGAINNQIQVAGPTLSDQQLQQKVARAITNGLIGNVPIAFQTITVQAHDGQVVLGGHAAGPIAASDAVGIAENTKGVKDLVDNIQVDPLSPMDNEIRIREYRAIYSSPFLSQYVMDPTQPVRIQVQNGHVTLYGVVDSQGAKDAAGIKANSVSGVFSVKNDIQVVNGSGEHASK